MKTTIITICLLLLGITAQAQQALQKYYTAVQALESQTDSEKKSEARGKALVVFYDERVKEAGTETAKNETAKLLRQYIDYDFCAASYLLLRLTNLDDAKYFQETYFNADEQAKSKLLLNRIVQAYNTRSEQPYPSGVPYPGNGVKGSWQNSGIAAALKDPNSNLASTTSTSSVAVTATPTKTADDGEAEFQKGVAAHQAKNYTEAISWYKKAVEKGHQKAKLMIEAVNIAIQMDEDERKIADDGIAEFKKGVTAYQANNYTEAMQWFQKSAEKGLSDAMVNIGAMYFSGQGVAQNYNESFNWTKKAADKGDAQAMNMLGTMYYNGMGTEYDIVEAMNWYKKAADKGNSDAMVQLGSISYQAGDLTEAKKWFQKAADKGNQMAKDWLSILD